MANSLQIIALASLVAVVALPVLAGQNRKQYPECMTRKKAVAVGLLMYSGDYDDRLPIAKVWMDVEMPYVKNEQVFKCSAIAKGYGTALASGLDRANVTGIQNPSKDAMAFESKDLKKNAFGNYNVLFPTALRHKEGNPVAYVDGHVKNIGG